MDEDTGVQVTEQIDDVETSESLAADLDIAAQMLELERTIKTYHSSILMKRDELKELRSSISDALQNDQVYLTQEEKMKETKMQQTKLKDQLLATPSVAKAKDGMKELSTEIKDLQDTLTKTLMRYYDLTKKTVITMNDGETYEIKQSLTLVKQSSKRTP